MLSKIAVLLIIGLGIAISCKKETGKEDKEKLNGNSVADIQETYLPDNAFPGFAKFINDAVGTDGVNEDYLVDDAMSFGETFANYLYTENDTFSIPIDTLKDMIQLTVSTYSEDSKNYITNANINALLNTLNSHYTSKAISLGFKENPSLHFKFVDFVWDESNIANNTLTFKVFVDVCFKAAMPPGCAVHDAFPNQGYRSPIANDGACFDPNDPNPYIMYSERWAFYQIHTRLNTPGLCNNDLGCTKTYTIPAPYSKYPSGYTWVSMKYGMEEKWTDNIFGSYNPNLWNGLAPDGLNPYVCESATKIESDYYRVLNASITQKPNYIIPNTTINTKKDIMSYSYVYARNDQISPGVYSTNLIPNDYWGQNGSFKYAVCVRVPVLNTATKKYQDWRSTL